MGARCASGPRAFRPRRSPGTPLCVLALFVAHDKGWNVSTTRSRYPGREMVNTFDVLDAPTTTERTSVVPNMRGWLHAGSVPLVMAAGALLIGRSPTSASRIGSAIFAMTVLTNFAVSAGLHRGRWSPGTTLTLRHLDHASIFLVIAGSCTPFALLMLSGDHRVVLLSITWAGAALGIGFRLFWTGAPRWLYTWIYIALGWAPIVFIKDFAAYPVTAVLVLIVLGGVLYTSGGIVYGLRRPDPFPRWFGFHEVFHTLTIAAFVSLYVGVAIITFSLR
jgi:hemolysin III